MEKNYYEILGVEPDATKSEIKNAYTKIEKEQIPEEIRGAFDTLIFERDKYDAKLATKQEVKEEKNYYEILGVKPDATTKEIIDVYLAITDKTEEVQIAFDTLFKPKSREQYDAKLSNGKKSENYYEVLGVKPDATMEEIIDAYNKKETKSLSEEIALKTLINPADRREYDAKFVVKENEKTAYEILGVKPDATTKEILDAYLEIKNKVMPEVLEAYNVLTDNELRAEYDAKLLKEKSVIETPESENLTSDEIDNASSVEVDNVVTPSESSKDKTPYEILGVTPGITMEELQKVYDSIEPKTTEAAEAFAAIVVDMHSVTSKNSEPLADNYDDIFSNSNDRIASLVKKSLPVVKKITKLGLDVLLVSASTVVAGIGYSKYKLSSLGEDEKTITEFKTEEAKLEAKYRENLLYDIEKKLHKPHMNTELEILKIRYENQIELLKRKIYVKENQKVKKGHFIFYKIGLMALKNQLTIYEEKLKEIEKAIKETKEKSEIPKLQEELIKVTEQIEELEKEPEKRTLTIKKLKIQQQDLGDKIKRKIEREKSKCFNRGIFEQKFISTRANIENFIPALFTPSDKLDEKGKTVR